MNGWKNILVIIQKKGNKAKNEFEKVFLEFHINSAFGKMIENVRNGLQIEFIKKNEYAKF